ncbi:hypothetical protein Fsol_00420 [Candidatus Fokinia solitaria]|uniref:Uncharacterized protein n=1 Tax=Candidatus Fokinia solitaria TaxID=1802984 RepID=A0A2U8BSC9_9RICK|nr:hypothetical protein [Candidatus Fokinia solitaria]AWD33215.1 hypothetical protein Fsol_00420 [Candidatus Fokinia solitaria]
MKKTYILIPVFISCIAIIVAFLYFSQQKDINQNRFEDLLKEKFASHGFILDCASITQESSSLILNNVTIVGALPIFKAEVLFDKIKVTSNSVSTDVELLGEVKANIYQSTDYKIPLKSHIILRDYNQFKLSIPANKNTKDVAEYFSFQSMLSNAKLYIDNQEKIFLRECYVNIIGNPTNERLIDIKIHFENTNENHINSNNEIYSLNARLINHEEKEENAYKIEKFLLKSGTYSIKASGDISFYTFSAFQDSNADTDMSYVKSQNIVIQLQNYKGISTTITDLVRQFYQSFFEKYNKSAAEISEYELQIAIVRLIEFISQDIKGDESSIHLVYDKKNGMTFSGKTNNDFMTFMKTLQLIKKEVVSK